jgi:4-amino-4-deoxy-L-arabinose transferase-like glycosyltransferase
MNSIDSKLPIVLILILAACARLIFMLVYPDVDFPDAVAYQTIGNEIFSGQVIKNHIYMPLYPIWTYIFGGKNVLILADIGISIATVYLVYLLSLELFKNKVAALLSSLISAFYPHFLFYAVTGLTETLYTFLLLAIFLLFYKKHFFWAVLLSILSILVRPSLDLLNPILVVIFIYLVHGLPWKIVLKYLIIYCISYILLMSPWWVHQYQKYGEFVRLNLGDGIVLFSGNNPMNVTGGGISRKDGTSDMDLSQFDYIKNPIRRNEAMKKEALNYIASDLGHFIELAGIKFMRFWRLWPHTQHYQQWYVIAASLLSYGIVLFFAIGFIFRNSKRHFRMLTPVFALFGYLTLIHMITIGSIRYRFPLEPFLIIFASYFFTDIFKKYKWIHWIREKL